MIPHRLFRAAVLGILLASSSIAIAQEPAKPAATAPSDHEAKFIATLTNATLKGRWWSLKDGQLGPEKEDSYHVVSVAKVEGDQWRVTARLKYLGKELDLPIPLQVKWAGDTPVLVLDGINLGAGRAYSARVMIYEHTYSGWWTASDHAGLISGVITNAK